MLSASWAAIERYVDAFVSLAPPSVRPLADVRVGLADGRLMSLPVDERPAMASPALQCEE